MTTAQPDNPLAVPLDDYILAYENFGRTERREARCRVRVFAPRATGWLPVVIATELPDNPGASITNRAERVWYLIVRRHWPEAVRAGVCPAVLVEHYPALEPGPFDVRYAYVDFPSYVPRPATFREPSCYPDGPEWAHVDRAKVEAQIGGMLVDPMDWTWRESRAPRERPGA